MIKHKDDTSYCEHMNICFFLLIQSCGSGTKQMFMSYVRMGKSKFNLPWLFDHGMGVGASQVALSIWETADLSGVLTLELVMARKKQKKLHSMMKQFCLWKAKLIQADRKDNRSNNHSL